MEFDWDNFFATASFKEIEKLAPELLWRPRKLSVFSPDKKLFYISSQEHAVETGNVDKLKHALMGIKGSYDRACRNENHAQAHIARLDFKEICSLLASHSEDPDEFSDPDSLLNEKNLC